MVDKKQRQHRSPWRVLKYVSYVVLVIAVVYVSFSLGSRSTMDPNNQSASSATTKSDALPDSADKKPLAMFLPETPDTSIEKHLKDMIPDSSSSPLNSCRVTSQMKLMLDPKQPNKWMLQSLDPEGTPKTAGGDEFYITFKHKGDLSDPIHPSAVGIAFDRQDGTYEIDFVSPPLALSVDSQYNQREAGGNLTVHLQYSCGIGFMAPPDKDGWPDGGAAHSSFTVLTPSSPTVHLFQPPSITAGILSKYEQVLVFGDSAMKQFVKNGSQAFKPNILFRVKRRKPWTMALIDEHLKVLHMQFGRDLDATNTMTTPSPSTSLLLGSSIWDVLASRQEFTTARRHLVQSSTSHSEIIFQDHLQACRHFITTIRQEYPNLHVLWKSPSAMHIHVVDPDNPVNHAAMRNGNKGLPTVSLLQRVRYMSSSRMFRLYQLQRELMQELQVPFLDIYEATYLSASWTLSGDGRHYSRELHQHMLDWFY